MYLIDGLTPKIGSRGKYLLKEPFQCDKDTIYTCESVGSISEFKTSNKIDVLTTFYLDKGLSETDYLYAIENNIKIVTLNSGSGQFLYIPDNFIEKLPDQGYIPYQQKIISVNLGLLPQSINIDETLNKIKSIVSQTLNVDTDPKIHVYDSRRFVSWEQSEQMEQVRLSKVSKSKPDWQIIKELQDKNAALSDALSSLEDIILNADI